MAPTQVNIAGRKVRIEYVTGALDEEDSSGECDLDASCIRVSDSLVEDALKSTVLHECMHGMADTLHFGWDEKRVLQVESAVFLFIKSNPELVQWLIGGPVGNDPSIDRSDR